MISLIRTRMRFRYPDDPTEVQLHVSAEEARTIADALIKADSPLGPLIQGFLEDSEYSDSLVIEIKERT